MKTFKLIYRIFGVVLCIALLVIAYMIYDSGNERKHIIKEFDSKKASLDEQVKAMNSIIQEYDDPTIISLRRLELIGQYTDEFPELMKSIEDFEKYVSDNEEVLLELGYDISGIRADISGISVSIEDNINGFKNDLEKMDSAFLISASSDKQNYRLELLQKIESLDLKK